MDELTEARVVAVMRQAAEAMREATDALIRAREELEARAPRVPAERRLSLVGEPHDARDDHLPHG